MITKDPKKEEQYADNSTRKTKSRLCRTLMHLKIT